MSNSHHARAYFKRIATIDQENYPTWDPERVGESLQCCGDSFNRTCSSTTHQGSSQILVCEWLDMPEKPLPKLPVPDLQSTLQKYMTMIEPIIPRDQYERTRMLVEEFGKAGGQGEELQKKLLDFSETSDNWIMDWWMVDMYMRLKLPLPVNSNPGMVFPRQQFKDDNDQLRFTARLISGIMDYKVIIDARSLPVDRASHREKGQPLCMAQYYRLFTSYRVPGVDKDYLLTDTCQSNVMSEPEHIIVICNNQLFVLDVVVNFVRLNVDNLYTQLRRIKTVAEQSEDLYEPIGVLTSLDRASWAISRMHLMDESTNRDCLDLIERCIFVLCLDRAIDTSFNHINSVEETRQGIRDDFSRASQMLMGLGSRGNSCNRWFDKTMQFVVCEDGTCGLNYEHSPSEGIAVVQLIEHLLKYMEEVRHMKLPRINSLCELPNPRRLNWKINEQVLEEIEKAKLHIDRLADDLDLYVLRFNEFGREFPKTQSMSPDSFIQLALQLTYYKVHGRLVPTYESASIRRFHLGRVDNIRAASPPTLEWVRAMVGEVPATERRYIAILKLHRLMCPNPLSNMMLKQEDEKMALLRKAINWQANNLVETILGHGIDNHLLGLKEMAVDLDIPEPGIFADETYKTVNQFTLSTSQVPTSMDAFMCYGAVVPDGYGVCYNPHPDYMVVVVVSFKSSPKSRSDHFSFTLESTFLQMRELCLQTNAGLPVEKPKVSDSVSDSVKPTDKPDICSENGGAVGNKNSKPAVLEHQNSNGSIKCGKQAYQATTQTLVSEKIG